MATKQIPAAVSNLVLDDIATSTLAIYTSMTTNPANAASITGVLLTQPIGTAITCTNVSGSTSLTVVNPATGAGLVKGAAVTGAGIPSGATISDIAGTTITLSVATTANVSAAVCSSVVKIPAVDLGSGATIQVNAATTALTAAASGTASCVILKTGSTATDGVIKAITISTLGVTATHTYKPPQFTITIPQAV